MPSSPFTDSGLVSMIPVVAGERSTAGKEQPLDSIGLLRLSKPIIVIVVVRLSARTLFEVRKNRLEFGMSSVACLRPHRQSLPCKLLSSGSPAQIVHDQIVGAFEMHGVVSTSRHLLPPRRTLDGRAKHMVGCGLWQPTFCVRVRVLTLQPLGCFCIMIVENLGDEHPHFLFSARPGALHENKP
jgi:hypothetical protein